MPNSTGNVFFSHSTFWLLLDLPISLLQLKVIMCIESACFQTQRSTKCHTVLFVSDSDLIQQISTCCKKQQQRFVIKCNISHSYVGLQVGIYCTVGRLDTVRLEQFQALSQMTYQSLHCTNISQAHFQIKTVDLTLNFPGEVCKIWKLVYILFIHNLKDINIGQAFLSSFRVYMVFLGVVESL